MQPQLERVEIETARGRDDDLAIEHRSGGVVTAIDVVDSTRERLVLDVTCSASDADHSHELEEAVDAIDGVEVYKVSDRTFLLHIGGKIEVSSKVPLKNRDDLSMAYTPGVGRVSMALYENPEDVSRLTIKGNSVAVVTDGSAVLGLGNIGPGAALPVMEGKAALFKRFANIDAWPICLASQDTDEIVRAVEMIAPGFGGINLEDIAAPRCFEIERRLRESLDIPVFHDDQHGTAIVVLAALTNALRVVEKELTDVPGRGRRARCGRYRDRHAAHRGRRHATWSSSTARARSAPATTGCPRRTPSSPRRTNPRHVRGDAAGVPGRRRRLHRGQRARHPRSRSGSPTWPSSRSCSRWPTRTPRWTPPRPRSTPPWSPRAAPTTRTRSTTCSPSRASSAACSTPGPTTSPSTCCSRAADAIAHVVRDEELNPNFIIPTVFNAEVPKAVAAAIRGAR